MSETPPDAAPELEAFLQAQSLAELRASYTALGVEFPSERVYLRRAQKDFFRRCREACKQPPPTPAELEPVTVTREGRTYGIYGVIHGMIGGASKEYKQFVNARTKSLPLIGFENGLRMFYPSQRAFTIPDYVAMGVKGSVVTGLQVGLMFPLLVFESLREVLKLGGGAEEEEDWDPVDYTPAYHALDPELRRGVEPDPPLPSRLQIEYELGRWGSWGAAWENPAAIVPRSLFMAGYALGYAEREGLETLDLVVGDLHTMEIARFLEGAPPSHRLFAKALAMGGRSSGRRRFDLWWTKVRHLGLAGTLGAVIMVSGLLLVYNALLYLGVL
ncbi:MAG: hypothetical protein R3F62_03005 [Planctomycetota bacterium]